MPNLNSGILADVPVKYPDYEEQVLIAKCLCSIEQKIALNKRINAELEALAKTIYDYWFVQFDFPDENGKPYRTSGGAMEYNDQLKREIPKGWSATTVGAICRNFDSQRVPLSQKERDDIHGNIPYYGATGIMDYVSRFIFDGQFILIAEDGSVMDSQGLPIVQMIWEKTWVNNHAHVLQGINGYSNELLYHILKEIPVVKIKTGSIQMKINQDNLNTYKIPSITKDISTMFSQSVKAMYSKIHYLQMENNELTRLRDWLLPMLMNGQATVADEQPMETPQNVVEMPGNDKRFDLWLQNQGIAARGDLDKKTLREIFDAMDDDDK